MSYRFSFKCHFFTINPEFSPKQGFNAGIMNGKVDDLDTGT
jgi:hypothetical protein